MPEHFGQVVSRRGVDGRGFDGALEQLFRLGPIAHFHRGDALLRQVAAGGDVFRHRAAAASAAQPQIETESKATAAAAMPQRQ